MSPPALLNLAQVQLADVHLQLQIAQVVDNRQRPRLDVVHVVPRLDVLLPLGGGDGEYVEITSGLNEGDAVLVPLQAQGPA